MTNSRRMKQVEHTPFICEIRDIYKAYLGKPEERKILGRHEHKWEYKIKMLLGKYDWRFCLCYVNLCYD
jgi:hypothetical protein